MFLEKKLGVTERPISLNPGKEKVTGTLVAQAIRWTKVTKALGTRICVGSKVVQNNKRERP